MVAVYCNCLVQLKFVLGSRTFCYDSECFSAWQFLPAAPEVLAEIKTKNFTLRFAPSFTD